MAGYTWAGLGTHGHGCACVGMAGRTWAGLGALDLRGHGWACKGIARALAGHMSTASKDTM